MSNTREGYNSFSRSLSVRVLSATALLVVVVTAAAVGALPMELGGEIVVAAAPESMPSTDWPGIGVPLLLGDAGGLTGLVNASSCPTNDSVSGIVSRSAYATHLGLEDLLADLEGLELAEDLGEDCVWERHGGGRVRVSRHGLYRARTCSKAGRDSMWGSERHSGR